MTHEEFKELEQRYLKEKKVQEAMTNVTQMRCPVCGEILVSRIRKLGGDCSELKAVIECRKCRMFHAESRTGSYYEKVNIEATLIEEVTRKVAPYIKKFETK